MTTPEVRAQGAEVNLAPEQPREEVDQNSPGRSGDLPHVAHASRRAREETESGTPGGVPHGVELLRRIRSSRTLPKGLRERLCEFVQTLQLSEDADAVPAVPVAEAVEMIEAALPEHFQLAADELESPPHPRGENFFTGAEEELSDEDAQRIAAEQLAAAGFGP